MTQSLNADVYDVTGKVTGSFELPAELFDVEVNIPLIHQVVNAQLAAARQGTHSTKTRGEVSGGGKKPFKQKGTGRARQGSIRAPQFTGGGTVHGPKPRDYSQRTPKKMIAAALCQSLSDRARNGRIHVVEAFLEGEKPSTKAALGLLRKVIDDRAALVAVSRGDDLTRLSLRNAPEASVIFVDQLNSYDVLVADDVVFTESALTEYVSKNGKEEK
ncbi:50S ribosomal protein L4 [Actinomyces sp. oral taxon 848 str. F0332]|uniref:Large ribosomal subunit protein uL4 n=1 Tax=Peptidiphaga gingivicola TaxID=2741497 RepID=A0A179B657_9ACTO|nr:50S ribosomal protein L4 [Peptidiphaga gingivicola]EEZ78456.1 50S ribosomal protein L4 [Actinomyces sp. oral taxon 848 str. F0332]OAP86524.1 50S ribosomal protein L4 [Peptidiphaga gingivicola]